jgi:hypothetical protein
MLVELTELIGPASTGDYKLKKVYVNPTHICKCEEENSFKRNSGEAPLIEGLDRRHSFTRLSINEGHANYSIVVLGTPEDVVRRLKNKQRGLLKG